MGQILFFLNDTFAINLIRTLEAENKTRGDLYFFRKLSPKTLQLEVTCHTTSKRNEKNCIDKSSCVISDKITGRNEKDDNTCDQKIHSTTESNKDLHNINS
jgi:hypothetical protein